MEEGEQPDELPHVLIIFDDIMGNKHDIRYNAFLDEMMFAGRHYKLHILKCLQDVKGEGPDLRQNEDGIFLTYQTQKRAFDTISEEYGKFFPQQFLC